MTWYYGVIIIAVVVIMYVMLIMRQKRQEKQSKEIMESFKVGDKVLTGSGIYGKIKRIYNTSYGKVCTLEIGTLEKLEIEFDMRGIVCVDEKTAVADEPEKEDNTKTESVTTEVKEEKVVEEQKVEKSNKKKKK